MGVETATLEVTGKGIGWFFTNVIKPYLTRRKRREQDILKKITEIHAELKFNGGSSIKDAIFDIKNQITHIDTRLNGIQENQHVSMNLQGIAFWISNPKGECEYASTNLCKLLGRNESELMGNAWLAWVVPDARERIHESWLFSVENKSAFDEFYTFKRSDGKFQKVWGLAIHRKSVPIHACTMGKLEAIGEPFKI